jgi:TonB family protein
VFSSQIPSLERFSAKRLVISALLHATALFLAISVRFSTPVAPATAAPARVLMVASLRIPPPAPRIHQPTLLATPKPAARAFTAPTITAPPRPQIAAIEATLPEPAQAPPPLTESLRPTVLPPPPVVIGKLATASVDQTIPAQGTTRTTTFGIQATASQPDPVRSTKASGFGNASLSTNPQPKSVVAAAPTAVEILSKPRPLYTDEARQLRIEGEVLLEVLFSASGTARVERILRGLGHGLDEAAAASAANIRFRPAQRAGQPVDQLATVHITFQHAY